MKRASKHVQRSCCCGELKAVEWHSLNGPPKPNTNGFLPVPVQSAAPKLMRIIPRGLLALACDVFVTKRSAVLIGWPCTVEIELYDMSELQQVLELSGDSIRTIMERTMFARCAGECTKSTRRTYGMVRQYEKSRSCQGFKESLTHTATRQRRDVEKANRQQSADGAVAVVEHHRKCILDIDCGWQSHL